MHKDPYQIKPLSLLLLLLLKHKKKAMLLIFLTMIIGTSSSVNAILLKNIIDTADSFTGQALISNMLIWGGIYVLWSELWNITYRSYDYFYLKTMPMLKGSVIEYFYNHIQGHSHVFFQNELPGNISNRIMETTKSLEYFVSSVNEKIIKKFTSVIIALCTLYYVHYIFAAIFSAWLILFLLITMVFAPTINKFSSSLAGKKAQVSGKIIDAISNIGSIRMFWTHDYEKQYLNHYITKFIKSDINFQWFLLKIRYALGSVCTLMTFGMIYYLTKLKSQNIITTGDFVLILSICSDVANEIWELSEEMGDALEDYGSFKQSCLLLSEHNVVDSSSAKKLEVTQGAIEFRNVIFKYREQNILFNDKSITIPGKQKIGLVGYSGSGKTSFVNLISRLYDVDSGEILIDGQNIAKVTQQSLKDAISFIPQDPILFHRSIIENIRYGKLDASDEEVFEAAKKAHVHDVIMGMSSQYQSLCGEKGGKLSGGQRQRIIIARAILKNAPILILDEATSSLDSLTEQLIQESLEFLMKSKTVLVIAHRLSTLLSMDKILVFENGKIVESGSHEELMKQNGLYSKFWYSQNKHFIET